MSVFLSVVAEHTVMACGEGIIGTVGGFVEWAVDPPDPGYRKLALPMATKPSLAKAPCPRGRGARCRRVISAAHRYQRERAAEVSLVEAAAVSANRYGNAQSANDTHTADLQRTAWRAYTALILRARKQTQAARRQFLHALGAKKVRLTEDAQALVREKAGELNGMPPTVERRLIKRHLITSRFDIAHAFATLTAKPEAKLDGPPGTPRAARASRRIDARDAALLLRAAAGAHPSKRTKRAVLRHLRALAHCGGEADGALKVLAKALKANQKPVLPRSTLPLARVTVKNARKHAHCTEG
jgi:hypothetical protein